QQQCAAAYSNNAPQRTATTRCSIQQQYAPTAISNNCASRSIQQQVYAPQRLATIVRAAEYSNNPPQYHFNRKLPFWHEISRKNFPHSPNTKLENSQPSQKKKNLDKKKIKFKIFKN